MIRALPLLLLCACSFDPDIGDGTVTCGVDDSCPPGFQCGRQNRCWREATTLPPSIDAAVLEPDACMKTTCMAEGAMCGTLSDLCGGMLDCGKCHGHQMCVANQCQGGP